ncbi:MAG: 16S rRNA (guanine(966)-N(2))-methyltransferase RsmD [Flavobacteriales bacterium]|nr:16S rRNA (guanine(966)-N(2))-methyltransferase RsmD [Flavobacteriales bacterium]
MRIISGRLKGRNIRPPRNLPVRPTTDMAKEGLFNILNNRFDFDGLRTLDLFCGTGNISLELLSRGVEDITCVDANPGCAQFVKQSLEEYGCERSNVVRADALQFLGRATGKWDIIFADPPFDNDVHAELVELILHRGLLEEDGLLIIEHPSNIDLSTLKGYEQTRRYGRLHFSFFSSEA